jgi:hypothetical protein
MKAGWLVVVLSLVSRKMTVAGAETAALMATPLFVDGVVTQPCTWLVTSNVT